MSSFAKAFLSRVLPSVGYKCAVVLQGDKRVTRFFPQTDALAEFIFKADAAGRTVYHACASFKVPQMDLPSTPRGERRLGRTHHNVLGLSSFWLDVDAGDGRPYRDAAEAFDAVAAFCQTLSLPTPTVVGSGVGLHIYWPVGEVLHPEKWRQYAVGLKTLCHQHGLSAGPERTADSSSILRTPGTHHRKTEPARPVECGALTGPYPLEAFNAFRQAAPVEQAAAVRTRSVFPAGSLLAAAANIYETAEVDGAAVAANCQQLRAIAGSPHTANEPRWYAALGVLAFCRDGIEIAKRWSTPEWYATIEEKAERQKEFGPSTCGRFQTIYPQGCVGCPFKGKITTPLQTARSLPEAKSELPQKANGVHSLPGLFSNSATPSIRVATINLPENFQWGALDRLSHVSEDNNGGKSSETLNAYPMWLSRVQRGEINSDNQSLVFAVDLPQEGLLEVPVSSSRLFGVGGIGEVAGRGLVLHDGDLFRRFTRESIDMHYADRLMETRYEQYGWKDNETAFLYGPNLYTAAGSEPMTLEGEIRTRAQFLQPAKGGSLERWTRAANALFAAGCEPQSFALLASFAAPLMRFHSSGEGGAIVSLVNDRSGSGKTTALEAAASVWGREEGIKLKDDDTKISKGIALGALGNLPATYDELYNRDPEIIRQFVLMFTNGADRARGTIDGTIRHTKGQWQTILMLASNLPIADMLSNMGGTDAPAYRLLEFYCEIPKGIRRGDVLRRELKANSGFAADRYLRSLLQPATLAFIKSALPRWTDDLYSLTGLSNEHRFWIRTIASTLVAAVIVKELGLVDFQVGRIKDWVIELVKDRSLEATPTRSQTSVDVLSEFLQHHQRDLLVCPHGYRPRTPMRPLITPSRHLLMRYDRDDGKLFIAENTIRKWMARNGHSWRAIRNDLAGDMVILQSSRRLTLAAGTDLAGGQAVVIEVNMNHPLVSGMLAPIENFLSKGKLSADASV